MHPKRDALPILDVISILMLIVATFLVFTYAPMEKVMGQVQRVFYFHVASAWVGMLGFLAAAFCGVMYLARSDRRWDIAETSAVEIGLVFSIIAIISGSIWARPIWNTWWTWDPRLTTVTVMVLVYAAYLMLRSGLDDPDRRARFGAVYAVIGFLSVPLTFFSARLFRTIHPVVIGANQPGAAGGFDMTSDMRLVFFFSLLTFTLIFASLLWRRVRLGHLQDRVEQLKLKHNV